MPIALTRFNFASLKAGSTCAISARDLQRSVSMRRRDERRDNHLSNSRALRGPADSNGSQANLGACLNSHCSILSESDSSLGYEQVFSPLEYRSDAASAAECAGLCAERPCLAVYR